MDRIEQPRNERSRATRTAILEAAVELLASGDVPGLSMSRVAELAGVSRRGLYLHFGSRGQLFAEMFDHVNRELGLEASIAPVVAAQDGPTALAAWARHTATFHTGLLPLARAVDRARHTDEDAAALWEAAMHAWMGACRALAARLAEEGSLAAPWTEQTAADLLWSLMSVDLVDDLVNERGWSVDELAQRLTVIAERTLLSPTR